MVSSTKRSTEVPQSLPVHQATLGTESLQIMIARSGSERSTGLMYRDPLNDHEGMLFCFAEPQYMRFWMKNTKAPLDIVFFSPDLRVTEFIRGMVPGYGQPEETLPLYASREMAQYALELASGSITKLGIKAGDMLIVPGPVSLNATP